MKNLNEEINKMKHLFNYKKGVVISEQNNYDPKVTSTECLNSADDDIVKENYEGLLGKGFKCVGRKYSAGGEGTSWSRPEMDDIYLKKDIECRKTVKTLFIYIKTKPFSTLTKVGDLEYYVPGFGEGKTTLESVDGLIKSIEVNN